MPTSVRVQPQGFQVQYPRTSWRVSYVEELSGKFRFVLSGQDFQFEPRDKYRYPNYDDAKRAAFCFLELMKRLERSRQRLGILAEIGVLKFPQQMYRSYQVWLLVDRVRYTWEAVRGDGVCIRSQYWYKRPENALSKAFAHVEASAPLSFNPERSRRVDWEIARTQIRDVIGWV